MQNTQVIILAAGHGKRMQSELPKALQLLAGKTFIKHVLDAISLSGVCDNPVIVVGQKREEIIKELGEGYKYAVQDEQNGTGHAVLVAESLVNSNNNIVLVLYADHPLVSPETIKKLVQTHQQSGKMVTMATATVPDFLDWKESFSAFGRIIRDENEDIIKIVEIKDATEEERQIKEVNPAYMCFNNSWMWKNLHNIKNDNNQKEYYLTDLIGMAFKDNQKIASISIDPKEALGVNTKEQLEVIEKLISK